MRRSIAAADSTGFAVYGPARERGFILRGIGFDKTRLGADMDEFRAVLRAHGSDFLEEPSFVTDGAAHYSARIVIDDPVDLARWIHDADDNVAHFEVQSCGGRWRSSRTSAAPRRWTKSTACTRCREPRPRPCAARPPRALCCPTPRIRSGPRPFPMSPSSQRTDHRLLHVARAAHPQGLSVPHRERQRTHGVWVSDQIAHGLSLPQALKKSITSIDGVFTYLIADRDGIGFAKDRFAMKPLVVVEENGEMSAATEEQAVRRVHPGECDVINYDGPP